MWTIIINPKSREPISYLTTLVRNVAGDISKLFSGFVRIKNVDTQNIAGTDWTLNVKKLVAIYQWYY